MSQGNSDGSSCNNPTTPRPVIIATGEKLLEHADFVSEGYSGLSLVRTYRSRHNTQNQMLRIPMFGQWSNGLDHPNIEYSCVDLPGDPCSPAEAIVRDPDGTTWRYVNPFGASGGGGGGGAVWLRGTARTPTAPAARGSLNTGWIRHFYVNGGSAAAGELIHTPGIGWELHRNERIYRYNATGYLRSIANKAGTEVLRVTRVSATDMRVARITNAAGHQVSFTWVGHSVTAVVDPRGQTWTYGYNAHGMLSSVTSPAVPGMPVSVRTYHYEKPGHPRLLTGYSVNGVRKTRYDYDALGRTILSGTENGEERDTFEYGHLETRVRSATGLVTTYRFVSAPEGLRLTSVSRPSMGRCPAASASIGYDAAGYINSRTNWRGV